MSDSNQTACQNRELILSDKLNWNWWKTPKTKVQAEFLNIFTICPIHFAHYLMDKKCVNFWKVVQVQICSGMWTYQFVLRRLLAQIVLGFGHHTGVAPWWRWEGGSLHCLCHWARPYVSACASSRWTSGRRHGHKQYTERASHLYD